MRTGAHIKIVVHKFIMAYIIKKSKIINTKSYYYCSSIRIMITHIVNTIYLNVSLFVLILKKKIVNLTKPFN